MNGYDGKPIKGEDKKELLLKTVLINALNFSSDPQDKKLTSTAEQKVRAYDLSIMLMKNKEVELKSEDIVYIKTRLGKMYTPLIFGQTIKLLEDNKK